MNKLEINIYFALSLLVLVMLGAPGDTYIFSTFDWHVENETSYSLDEEQEEFEQFKSAMLLSEHN